MYFHSFLDSFHTGYHRILSRILCAIQIPSFIYLTHNSVCVFIPSSCFILPPHFPFHYSFCKSNKHGNKRGNKHEMLSTDICTKQAQGNF